MKKHKILLYVLITLLTGACISEFNAQLPSGNTDILVVEGNIIGDSVMNFYFSKSFSLDEVRPPSGYDNVQVKLTLIGSNGYRSPLAAYLGQGVHQLAIGTLDEQVSYGIEFEYDGETYQSELSRPLHTPAIDSVSWNQPGEYADVSIRVSTHEDKSGYSYFLWGYKEDWEISAQYQTEVFFDPLNKKFYLDRPAPYYYCWKKNTGSEILVATTAKQVENRIVNHSLYTHEAQDDRFSILYSVLVHQISLSKAGYEYYLDLSKGNEGMGGLFTPQPSKIEGNINCITNPGKRVIGYIEVAHNATSYRLYVPRSYIQRKPSTGGCSLVSRDSISSLLKDGLSYFDIYFMGLRPCTYTEDPALSPDDWSSESCTDCRMRGGSKTKPDFWPNNHQ